MCGITGFINFNGHNREEARDLLKRMADTLYHRGPDEEGYHVDEHAALGHRRLSIIDLSSGQQPMHTEDQRLLIIFNGEIYNYLELKEKLQQRGHIFRSKSDTEAILMGYREWGENIVEKLNGMFAFAIWDSQKKSLFLARDRVGKKPLYYCSNGNKFIFASELKALKPFSSMLGSLSKTALDCYFTLGYIPSPRTIYEKTNKLEPGHSLLVTSRGLKKQRYWHLNFSPRHDITLDQATEEFEALLDEATRCRLMSEVPLGAFLSGGFDSTLVVSSMAKSMEKPVLSNSIGFGEKRYNELPLAQMVAEHLKTDHREYTLVPQAANILDKIAWHFDEPFADSSAIPTWYVCQMARKSVTVALSGDGGDESFGGYTFRYLPHMFESKIRNALPVPLRAILFGPLGSVWPASAKLPKPLRLKTIFENLALSDVEAFYRDLIWLRPNTREALYTSDFMESLQGFTPLETVAPLYNSTNATNPNNPNNPTNSTNPTNLFRAQYTDIHLYMTEDVLVKVDRMSMAHSLEVRSPLLDHRIIEFAATLPAHLKLDKSKGKIVLRNLAAIRLPKQILNHPKTGFSIPAAQWLRKELRPMVESAISRRNSITQQTLKPNKLSHLWQEHLSGHRNHDVFFWSLMMLDLWEQKHYNK